MKKHRSRLDWLKYGDRNTSLFQAKIRERDRTNQVRSLKAEDGLLLPKQEHLGKCTKAILPWVGTVESHSRTR
jgi:hypothetical protein